MSPEEAKELYEKATQQFLDLFAIPEIKRRQVASLLPDPFELLAFQIIFFADSRKPEIRLNSEVKAHAKMKLKAGVVKQAGEIVYSNELEGLEELTLTESEDPDCGHATMLRIGNMIFLAFDFLYNKDLSAKHIEHGDQFLRTAESAFERHDMSACVDNLFSAAELYAKAFLLVVGATPEFRKKPSHGHIHARLNQFAALGNIDKNYASAFNTLSKLRVPARYVNPSFSITDQEAKELITTVKSMGETARTWPHAAK